jgi:uncharacterized membrane protein
MNRRTIKKIFYSLTEVEKMLLLSVLFSILLVAIRAVITNTLVFIFLPWNLFLAAVPFLITTGLFKYRSITNKRWKMGFLLVAWILFLPNSFYIITDLFHLKPREESSRWFDLTLIFSFAWNGFLMGILSVRQMEKVVASRFSLQNTLLFVFPVMWLIAIGVYIGRFLRFNSWDIISNPFELLQEIGYMMIHPLQHFSTWGMIACFAAFMTIAYLSMKKMAKMME